VLPERGTLPQLASRESCYSTPDHHDSTFDEPEEA
jgi:hypothetical protein